MSDRFENIESMRRTMTTLEYEQWLIQRINMLTDDIKDWGETPEDSKRLSLLKSALHKVQNREVL